MYMECISINDILDTRWILIFGKKRMMNNSLVSYKYFYTFTILLMLFQRKLSKLKLKNVIILSYYHEVLFQRHESFLFLEFSSNETTTKQQKVVLLRRK